MDRGHLVALGSPGEVLTPELLHRVFQIRAAVIPHPVLGHPLVLPLEPAPREPGGLG